MRPRARIISLIGDELISDESVAIVELVKNAYDADAHRVMIEFGGDDLADPDTLTISDDGVGMDITTVMTGWFEPGTLSKKRAERSPSGRTYQGAKGVGRFAAARLGQSLYLETKQDGAVNGTTVLLEWGEFDEDSYLDEIEIDYEVRPLPAFTHGTKLTLMNLHARKHWAEDDFRELHTRLSRLISPFQSNDGSLEINDFKIELQVPGHPDLTGEVEPHKLVNKPKYKMLAEVTSDGHLTGTLEIDGHSAEEISQQLPNTEDQCGPLVIEIRAWDRDRTGLAPYMSEFDTTLTRVRQILDNYCGVSIYRDGFRVHPYGERGNDWLSLDTRSRQNPTFRLANNQVVAAIRISREDNPLLKDRTTREGLVHNNAYTGLVDRFTSALAIIEEHRYRVRPRKEREPEQVSTLFEYFEMSEVVEQADRQLGKKHPVAQLVKKKEVEVREGVARLQDHYSRVVLAAGFGQLVDIVVHEIGAPLGRATREVAYLERTLIETFGETRIRGLENTFTNIKAWLEQISMFREGLLPRVAAKRGRATSFSIQDEINGNLELYSNLIAKQKIQVAVRAPSKRLVVHMARSSFGQVVVNLLDNSVYWLTRHHGDGRGGHIDIQVTSLKHGFRVRFSDDGPGVIEEDQDLIFEQQFTRKPSGMGLGLFVARQLMEPYGRLVYRQDCKLPGACFEATFEQRVGL
ncbi:MAG: sensor histidine kinase [Phycisphaeraceae bacterium]|nr:sensor histidine kinase [Phycisphaeraceae bacterium]MCB9848167.1 sensor histidine kinase [Phycisphaeraceae bacterium]